MTQDAKIYLSAEELQMAADYQWILTKRIIIEKMAALLGSTSPELRQLAADMAWLPEEVRISSPKLGRGENYHGLPWLMLDCPAYFSREAVFALRSFFWWGHGFSVTLHLSGRYKAACMPLLEPALPTLQAANWLIGVHEKEWEHHFETVNCLPAVAVNIVEWQRLLRERSFVKITTRFALHQWAEIPLLITDTAVRLFNLLKP